MVYLLLFQKEKIFLFNRFYLISAMFISFVIPLLTFSVQIVVPLEVTTIQPVPANIQPFQSTSQKIDWNKIMELAFFTVMVVLSVRIVAGHVKVWRIVKKASRKTIYGHSVWVTTEDIPSFAYFKKIIIPSSILKNTHLQTVILHEEIHIKGQHCIDLCLAEVLCLLQWFNPFVWLLKKAIGDNLEFLTDDMAVSQINQQEYQLGMVSLASKTMIYNFPTVSNQSQLKKRIVMMKKTKSIKQQWIKTLVIIPVLTILTITLSGREVRMVYVDPVMEENIPLADGKEISGKVTDGNGTSLNGVPVIVKDEHESIIIRSLMKNFSSKETPLVIIDGKKYPLDSSLPISSNDIKSVTVLKNERAYEAYGEEGKNGVIIIEVI